MPMVTCRGLSLHTQELGEGPPVVMLHGLLIGSLATWFFTSGPELAKHFHVLMYDLRGHGRSDRPDTGYDLGTMTGDLECLLEQVNGFDRRIALVGHSYGALVALTYALSHPDRVARLVLIEAPLPPSRFDEMDPFFQRTPQEMIDALPTTLKQSFETSRRGRRVRRLLASLNHLVLESSLVQDLRGESDIDDEVLATVQMPVLCVYGETSPLRPVGDRLVKVLPNARLVNLAGGHYLPLESPELMTPVLLEHLCG